MLSLRLSDDEELTARVHKTAKVLNKFPKPMGLGVKACIHDIQCIPA